MITLTRAKWRDLRQQLSKEYPPSIMNIRSAMKRELGFTPRFHDFNDGNYISYGNGGIVYLDFFDDVKETWFQLKYL